ncbi:MAG: IreB family regulatory phosphoprotein [Candidatus Nomurabacteria bacterium]|jgi:uncharacterized protein (UPF0297 family)|nr:IreB family regulatory phosphoprotein [Candidatus Nomurabacteria bacterium]
MLKDDIVLVSTKGNQTREQITTVSAIRMTLKLVYDIMKKYNYNAIEQMAAYLLSDDPRYISICDDARGIMLNLRHRYGRNGILEIVIKDYLDLKQDLDP